MYTKHVYVALCARAMKVGGSIAESCEIAFTIVPAFVGIILTAIFLLACLKQPTVGF